MTALRDNMLRDRAAIAAVRKVFAGGDESRQEDLAARFADYARWAREDRRAESKLARKQLEAMADAVHVLGEILRQDGPTFVPATWVRLSAVTEFDWLFRCDLERLEAELREPRAKQEDWIRQGMVEIAAESFAMRTGARPGWSNGTDRLTSPFIRHAEAAFKAVGVKMPSRTIVARAFKRRGIAAG